MSYAMFIVYYMLMCTSCDIALRWIPQNTFDDMSALVKVMAWWCQATSDYLSQSMQPYGITRPQSVNVLHDRFSQHPVINSAAKWFNCVKGKYEMSYNKLLCQSSPLRLHDRFLMIIRVQKLMPLALNKKNFSWLSSQISFLWMTVFCRSSWLPWR